MLSHRRQRHRAGTLVGLILLALSGCTTWRTQGPTPEAAIRSLAPRTLRITRIDGSNLTLRNPVVSEGDLVAEPLPATRHGEASRVRIPLAEVVSVATPGINLGKTFALLLATGGATLVALGLLVAGDDE
jgi:hypothetical protein